jgi:hypothetical protein
VRVLRKLRPAIAGAVALLLVAGGARASAQSPVVPYDGHSPFNCQIQNTGTGVAYPDPGADPFCVEFDKTQQNVTDLGMLVFLSLEPARTLAATPKCFYYQRDHWTASVVQGEQPEIYHWDGGYFFDKARGIGGAALTHFRVGGQAYDPRQLPFPPEFKTYFLADGGGGAVAWNGQQVDPACVAKVDTPEKAARVYAQGTGAGEGSPIRPVQIDFGAVPVLRPTMRPTVRAADGQWRFSATGYFKVAGRTVARLARLSGTATPSARRVTVAISRRTRHAVRAAARRRGTRRTTLSLRLRTWSGQADSARLIFRQDVFFTIPRR